MYLCCVSGDGGPDFGTMCFSFPAVEDGPDRKEADVEALIVVWSCVQICGMRVNETDYLINLLVFPLF